MIDRSYIIEHEASIALIFLALILLSGFVSWCAKEKARHPLGWFLLSLVLSPFITLLGLIAIPEGRYK